LSIHLTFIVQKIREECVKPNIIKIQMITAKIFGYYVCCAICVNVNSVVGFSPEARAVAGSSAEVTTNLYNVCTTISLQQVI
jgi:hypothetical protein